MKNAIFLSHPYDSNTPGFGGEPGFERTNQTSIQNQQSSNSEKWRFKNHTGTHVDFPFHFFANGDSLSSYQAHQFFMEKTELLELPCLDDQIITVENLEKIAASDAEFLVFRTGFEQKRQEEPYWKHNPGFHPDVAPFLRQRFPRLRGIGFDFISLTAFQHRELGREAHRQFLNPKRPIWIVEDMKLSPLTWDSFSCLIAPFLVAHADGTPVSVFAFK